MKVYIFEEPLYSESDWCQKINKSVMVEIKKLRLQYEFVSSKRSIEVHDEDFALIISSSLAFSEDMIEYLRKQFRNRIILITLQTWQIVDINIHTISASALDIMLLIFDYLSGCKKTKVALCGINKYSINDLSKMRSYQRFGGNINSIYYNNSGIQNCFESLKPDINKYDAIICTNDVVAYYLHEQLQKRAYNANVSKPIIISCISSVLFERLDASICFIEFDWPKFGYAVRKLINTFLKMPNCFSSVNINIPVFLKLGTMIYSQSFENSDLSLPRLSKQKHFENEMQIDIDNDMYIYYDDSDVKEILCYKRLLETCDELDFKLLNYIKSETPVQTICEETFLSESGYKYRINQIKSRCNIQSKQHLKDIVVKYMH